MIQGERCGHREDWSLMVEEIRKQRAGIVEVPKWSVRGKGLVLCNRGVALSRVVLGASPTSGTQLVVLRSGKVRSTAQ
jgi:hypothetical protein